MSEKWHRLVETLFELTKANRIEWQEMSDSDTFQTVVGMNSVEIENSSFDNFEVRLRDETGRMVDKFSDDDLNRITGSHYTGLFSEMFNLIRRQMSGSERVLDDVLAQLRTK